MAMGARVATRHFAAGQTSLHAQKLPAHQDQSLSADRPTSYPSIAAICCCFLLLDYQKLEALPKRLPMRSYYPCGHLCWLSHTVHHNVQHAHRKLDSESTCACVATLVYTIIYQWSTSQNTPMRLCVCFHTLTCQPTHRCSPLCQWRR